MNGEPRMEEAWEKEALLLQRRTFVRILHLAVNDSCTCGGRGPDDPDCCPACSVWHLVMEHDD